MKKNCSVFLFDMRLLFYLGYGDKFGNVTETSSLVMQIYQQLISWNIESSKKLVR